MPQPQHQRSPLAPQNLHRLSPPPGQHWAPGAEVANQFRVHWREAPIGDGGIQSLVASHRPRQARLTPLTIARPRISGTPRIWHSHHQIVVQQLLCLCQCLRCNLQVTSRHIHS